METTRSPPRRRRRRSLRAGRADLAPVKAFLLDHTERLKAETAELREGAEAYYALAEAADFDYATLLEDKRAEVQGVRRGARRTDFAAANPAYEEMEGVVAGVPSLADYDVIIDAGADGTDPGERRAVHAQDARRARRSSSPATSTT